MVIPFTSYPASTTALVSTSSATSDASSTVAFFCSRLMVTTFTPSTASSAFCTVPVQKALEAVEGVKTVTMSLEQKNATVELASDVADEVLTKAVVDAGYEVKGITSK